LPSVLAAADVVSPEEKHVRHAGGTQPPGACIPPRSCGGRHTRPGCRDSLDQPGRRSTPPLGWEAYAARAGSLFLPAIARRTRSTSPQRWRRTLPGVSSRVWLGACFPRAKVGEVRWACRQKLSRREGRETPSRREGRHRAARRPSSGVPSRTSASWPVSSPMTRWRETFAPGFGANFEAPEAER
jgi:hypothetical protein